MVSIIQVVIMTEAHITKLQQTGLQNELSEESKKEHHQFWCNLVSQTVGGATQWNATAFRDNLADGRTQCGCKDSTHRSMARSDRSEQRFLTKPSSTKTNTIFTSLSKTCCRTSSLGTLCTREVDRILVYCGLGRPRKEHRTRSARLTMLVPRNTSHHNSGNLFVPMV